MASASIQRILDELPQTSPRERIDTMPQELPELTLGWGVIAWIYDNLTHPDGPSAGKPFQLTPRQAKWFLHFYAVNPDGSWVYGSGVRRLAKGSGKSPLAAVHALVELMGPVRVDHFDDSIPGGVVGKPASFPLVQVAATSERQTANTMRSITAMTHKYTAVNKKYELEVGKTAISMPGGGRLEQIASSAGSAEGAACTFVIADETEHWTPGQGGPRLMSTLVKNAAKLGNRVVETSNAWVPGQGSVAEATYEEWCLQQLGESRVKQPTLYDAVVAPANTALTDEPEDGQFSLNEALEWVYEDCPWTKIDFIKDQIWRSTLPVSESRAFYLNQPTAGDKAWVDPLQWGKLANRERVVEPGEAIVMFFDGSKSNDHTALVGCSMKDGFIFKIGVWAPDPRTGIIDVAVVDKAVRDAKDTWNVVAFWADVREFESQVHTTWPELFEGSKMMPASSHGLIAWDMRSHTYPFAVAAETCANEVEEEMFEHDGDPVVAQHIANAQVYATRGRYSITKESPKSPKKIDAAVCVVGARMLYRLAKETGYTGVTRRKEWSLT